MEAYLEVQELRLERGMLFHQVVLAAHFESVAVELARLHFEPGLQANERVAFPHNRLRIPQQRRSFRLSLHAQLLNLQTEPVFVGVELEQVAVEARTFSSYEYLFRTELGRVVLRAVFWIESVLPHLRPPEGEALPSLAFLQDSQHSGNPDPHWPPARSPSLEDSGCGDFPNSFEHPPSSAPASHKFASETSV